MTKVYLLFTLGASVSSTTDSLFSWGLFKAVALPKAQEAVLVHSVVCGGLEG